jgi:hypothetical protein
MHIKREKYKQKDYAVTIYMKYKVCMYRVFHRNPTHFASSYINNR